jgi:hypothetical protein
MFRDWYAYTNEVIGDCDSSLENVFFSFIVIINQSQHLLI